MSNRIDMSLDEIIKQDRITVGKSGKRNSFKSANQIGNQRRRKSGQVKKIGAVPRTMKSTQFPKKKSTKPMPNQIKIESTNHSMSNISSSCLLISNLHPRVSDSDIRELFSECGPLKSCSVHYSSTGRSLCKAQVVFVKLSDSNRAVHKYNQVPLDGRPLNIQPLITTPLKTDIAHRLGSIAQQVSKNNKSKSKQSNRSKQTNKSSFASKRVAESNRGNLKNKAVPKKMAATVDQLNADLDAYINQNC